MDPTEEGRGSIGEHLSVDFPWMESQMSVSRVLVQALHANLCACMHCGVPVLSEMDVKWHEILHSGVPCVISGCTQKRSLGGWEFRKMSQLRRSPGQNSKRYGAWADHSSQNLHTKGCLARCHCVSALC